MVKEYKYINTLEREFDFSGKKVIIWGKSVSALDLYVKLKTKSINVIGFTDSFADKLQIFAGLPLYPFDQIGEMKDIVIYIATVNTRFQIEILELLQGMDVTILCRGNVYGPGMYDINQMNKEIEKDGNKVQLVRGVLADPKSVHTFDNLLKYRMSNDFRLLEEVCENGHNQYFPGKDIFEASENEIFIDAGGYNGATSGEFSEWVHGKYRKIYLLEPDELMNCIAKEYVKLKGIHDIEIVQKGAYSKSTVLNFTNIAESGSSYIDVNGNVAIETISIDEMLRQTPATYIKMDIEGAEMQALEGASYTITRYKPKLAICIYHKDDDLWNIPYYIHEKYPWYKLFIRHYTTITTETILYAVC